MERILIKVEKYGLSPEIAVAGTSGSYGVCKIIFGFGEEWDDLQKRITFFPAGENSSPVAVHMDGNEAVVPAEVTSCAGTAEYVVDGIADGRRLISVCGKLAVLETKTPGGGESGGATPSEAEQMRLEMTSLAADVAALGATDVYELIAAKTKEGSAYAAKFVTAKDVNGNGFALKKMIVKFKNCEGAIYDIYARCGKGGVGGFMTMGRVECDTNEETASVRHVGRLGIDGSDGEVFEYASGGNVNCVCSSAEEAQSAITSVDIISSNTVTLTDSSIEIWGIRAETA